MSVGQPEDTRTTETGGGGPDCSSNLNPVFKCVHMSAVQPFLPCGKAHVASTNHLLHSTLAPPFLLSVSQTEWKTGWGWKRESLTSLFFFFFFDKAHVCLFKNKSWRASPVLFSTDEASATSHTGFTRVWADAWERGQKDCGMWYTVCLFLLSVFTCERDEDLRKSVNSVRDRGEGGGKWGTQHPTCTPLPSLWQSSCGWCTSWSAGKQPRSPGWLTGSAVQQTPGCWKSSGYSLEENTGVSGDKHYYTGISWYHIDIQLISF